VRAIFANKPAIWPLAKVRFRIATASQYGVVGHGAPPAVLLGLAACLTRRRLAGRAPAKPEEQIDGDELHPTRHTATTWLYVVPCGALSNCAKSQGTKSLDAVSK